jgi:hypothetical protein
MAEPPKYGDDDSQGDRRFRRGNPHDEQGEGDPVSVPLGAEGVERHEVQAGPVHDQLHGDEHSDQGATVHDAQKPASQKKQGGEEVNVQVMIYKIFCHFIFLNSHRIFHPPLTASQKASEARRATPEG